MIMIYLTKFKFIRKDYHMIKYKDTLLKAILAGVVIGIGGIAYLSVESTYLGSVLFGIGLFVIMTFSFNLFTGKVGYATEKGVKFIPELAVIFLGNFIGTAITALLSRFTRIKGISERALKLCETKLGDNLVSILILAFFCGILMYIAAEGFTRIDGDFMKVLVVFLPVVVFILAGFEHVIANMLYFTLAGVWSLKAVLYLLIMTLGNSLGGMFIPLVLKFVKQK